MNTTDTISFEVSNVKLATEPLPEVPYKQAVKAQITRGKVESCSRYHGRLLKGVECHPVVAAIHFAFSDHRPLWLTPDTIWLMIIQAVANHINAHAEELRPSIVSHQGKIAIDVRRDDFVKGSPENPWAEVFNEFSAQIRNHVGPKIDLFVPDFSTTGLLERAAAEIVLLDAMRSYFEYEVHSLCGIPTITLAGTHKDWKTLTERVQGFREFGLSSWLDVLSPILDQFARAASGDVDQTFWRSLYKVNDQSGGPVITGWITAFFPYLKDYRTKQATVPVNGLFKIGKGNLDAMLNPDHKRNRQWARGPTTEEFPSGLSKAPFRWNYLDQRFDMEFLGGFVGIAQDHETLALRPEIGWAIREARRGR